jgi:hypothetical protein
MTKLRKTYDLAQSSGRPLEEVALDRYGSMTDFEEAVEERRVLDERATRRDSRSRGAGSGASTPGGKGDGSGAEGGGGRERYMFTSDAPMSGGPGGSRPGSRAGFRRPGEDPSLSSDTPGTPSAAGSNRIDLLRRSSSFQQNLSSTSSGPSSPIPSVIAPILNRPPPSTALPADAKPPLSPRSLNKLQARALKAGLMGDDDEKTRLEREYDQERVRAARVPIDALSAASEGIDKGKGREDKEEMHEVKMLPTLDGMGKMYDVGGGKKDGEAILPGNRRPAIKVRSPPARAARFLHGHLISFRFRIDRD